MNDRKPRRYFQRNRDTTMPREMLKSRTPPPRDPYDPPRVEMSLSAEELAREVLYAGNQSGLG